MTTENETSVEFVEDDCGFERATVSRKVDGLEYRLEPQDGHVYQVIADGTPQNMRVVKRGGPWVLFYERPYKDKTLNTRKEFRTIPEIIEFIARTVHG